MKKILKISKVESDGSDVWGIRWGSQGYLLKGDDIIELRPE